MYLTSNKGTGLVHASLNRCGLATGHNGSACWRFRMCVYLGDVNSSTRIAWISTFFLAIALFYAPLAYGCTRPEMLPTLYALLLGAILTGVISFIVDQHLPAPRFALFCISALLLQGWWLVWFPIFPSVVSDNGGLVDTSLENIRQLSFNSMLLTTFSLGAFVVLCGLLNQSRPRRFILLSAALAGTLISVIGVFLKLTGDRYMHHFWKPEEVYWNDFAFYRYHGNAGAFLNLVWPIILVFTRRAYTPTIGFGRKIFWTVASLACGSALFLNASKVALVIGLLILPWPFATRLKRLNPKALLFLAFGGVLVVGAGFIASSRIAEEAAFARMTNATEVSGSFGGRVEAYRQFLDALPDAGAFGFGPGLFQLAFPYQVSPLGNTTIGLREYAHEDYLQTVLEWGWFGTLWWTLLVGGGLYRAIKSYSQRDLFDSKTERHLVLGAILGIGGTLAESLIDFPLQIASLRLFFLVLLALCWVSPRLLTKPVTAPSPRKRYRLPIPAELAEPLRASSHAR